MLLFGPDWHELSGHAIEFRAEEGASLTLVPTEVHSPHEWNLCVIKLDVELRLGAWDATILSRTNVYSYGAIEVLLRRLENIRAGQSEKDLLFQWENLEIFLEVRRERLRPRYWVTGSLGHRARPSDLDLAEWSTNFAFDWAFVDSPFPVDHAIGQVERLLDVLRARGPRDK